MEPNTKLGSDFHIRKTTAEAVLPLSSEFSSSRVLEFTNSLLFFVVLRRCIGFRSFDHLIQMDTELYGRIEDESNFRRDTQSDPLAQQASDITGRSPKRPSNSFFFASK